MFIYFLAIKRIYNRPVRIGILTLPDFVLTFLLMTSNIDKMKLIPYIPETSGSKFKLGIYFHLKISCEKGNDPKYEADRKDSPNYRRFDKSKRQSQWFSSK